MTEEDLIILITYNPQKVYQNLTDLTDSIEQDWNDDLSKIIIEEFMMRLRSKTNKLMKTLNISDEKDGIGEEDSATFIKYVRVLVMIIDIPI
jgi:hypothetical protein